MIFESLLETLVLLALGIGFTYISMYLAGQWNWPVSKNLVEEGRWWFYSWDDFPVLECMGMLLGMTVLPIIWERYRNTKLPELGFVLPPRWALYLVLVVLASIGFTVLSGGYACLKNSPLSLSRISFFAVYFCCVSVAEETLFRGILQRRIRHISNSCTAILLGTGVFILWHPLPDTLRGLLLRILGASLIAVLYDRFRSLYPSILFHWMINIGQI